jgi:hypothetical protein
MGCLFDAHVEEGFQESALLDEGESVPGYLYVVGLKQGGEVLVGDG